MNPGAINQSAKFSRRARDCMIPEQLHRWDALDSVLAGSCLPQHRFLAEEARETLYDYPAVSADYTPRHRVLRRATERQARRGRNRLLGRIRAAMRSGSMAQLEKAVDKYFWSFDAKLCAYKEAWKSMKLRDRRRTHILSLADYATCLDPYDLSCAVAQGHLIRKSGARPGSNDPSDYREIINPSIHHRAMHQLVLRVLEIFYPDLRDDQYAKAGRGSIAAVQAAITKMRMAHIQFVAECDIESFYPSIGEKGGLTSTNMLHEQLFMLPRAVVDSSVLASGMLVELPGGAALTSRQLHPGGMPQGSVVSSFLGEHIVRLIMTEAEELAGNGQEMIAFCDNIAVFGETREDVNSMIEPLVLSAKTNPYGDFRLRRAQSTRHKSTGMLFLGHHIRWHAEDGVIVEVSEDNVQKFQEKLARKLRACRFSSYVEQPEREEAVAKIEQVICGWIEAFQLVPGVTRQARELFVEVLREEPRATEMLFRDFLARWRECQV